MIVLIRCKEDCSEEERNSDDAQLLRRVIEVGNLLCGYLG